MKAHLFLSASLLGAVLLSACNVDTTGISPQSSRGPNPKSNANAAVVVTEFGDLQCPACRGAQLQVVPQVLEKYGSQIRFEFKHFPLLSIHQYTMVDAEASECAADQGKFWEYEQLAYDKQPDLNSSTPAEWAKQLGLNMDLFNRCTSSHIKKKEIMADYDAGTKLGVQGTPTFFVNGQKVESSVTAIGAAIEAASTGAMKRL